MPTLRKKPLTNPFPDRLVLLDDGSGDLWWIDHDGDLLYWEEGQFPDEPYEIRQTTVQLGNTDDNTEIEQAFALSTASTNNPFK